MAKIFDVSDAETEFRAVSAIRAAQENVFNQHIESWAHFAKACESEIEKLFLAGLIASAIEEMPNKILLLRPHNGRTLDIAVPKAAPAGDYAVLAIQPKIANYRIDFVLKVDEEKLSATVAIECDGHDFHEKTKEQAERDKSRDRALLSKGYPVVRFTGREIWRDTKACAMQVLDILGGEIEKQECARWVATL